MDRLEFKANFTADATGEISGMAWPFGSADRVGDIIEKGSFTSAATLPMLFGHDQAQAIGVWDSVTETDDGLAVKGRLLVNDVARAKEVHALIREGAVSGLSIGFVTQKAAPRAGGGRTITALDLHEISVVSIPAHPGARIISAKADASAETKDTTMTTEQNDGAAEIAALETKMTSRLDQLEAKLNRPAVITDTKTEDDAERKAFLTYARKGVDGLDPADRKAMTIANDASAGYLAPESFSSEIIKLLNLYSPIRQYARVTQIGGSEIKIPRRLTSTSAQWIGENAAPTASAPTYEQISFTPAGLRAMSEISNELLEDNTYNLEMELAADLAEQFAITEGAAFINGDGIGKPNGLLKTGAISNEVKTGVAADLPATDAALADKIFDVFHGIPTTHAQNGVWIVNRTILARLRKVKDTTGNFLLVPNLASGPAWSILGRTVVEAVDMPSVGAGNNVIVFGDLQGFRIIDRIGFSMLRDPYSLAANGLVRFLARSRVTSSVTHPDRLVRLKCSV